MSAQFLQSVDDIEKYKHEIPISPARFPCIFISKTTQMSCCISFSEWCNFFVCVYLLLSWLLYVRTQRTSDVDEWVVVRPGFNAALLFRTAYEDFFFFF